MTGGIVTIVYAFVSTYQILQLHASYTSKKQSRFLNIEQVSDNRAKVGERNRAGNTQKTSPHFLKRKTKGQV